MCMQRCEHTRVNPYTGLYMYIHDIHVCVCLCVFYHSIHPSNRLPSPTLHSDPGGLGQPSHSSENLGGPTTFLIAFRLKGHISQSFQCPAAENHHPHPAQWPATWLPPPPNPEAEPPTHPPGLSEQTGQVTLASQPSVCVHLTEPIVLQPPHLPGPPLGWRHLILVSKIPVMQLQGARARREAREASSGFSGLCPHSEQSRAGKCGRRRQYSPDRLLLLLQKGSGGQAPQIPGVVLTHRTPPTHTLSHVLGSNEAPGPAQQSPTVKAPGPGLGRALPPAGRGAGRPTHSRDCSISLYLLICHQETKSLPSGSPGAFQGRVQPTAAPPLKCLLLKGKAEGSLGHGRRELQGPQGVEPGHREQV